MDYLDGLSLDLTRGGTKADCQQSAEQDIERQAETRRFVEAGRSRGIHEPARY
jgi:hypothetical protein